MHSLSVSPGGSQHAFLYDDSMAVKIMIINALTKLRGKGPPLEGESRV